MNEVQKRRLMLEKLIFLYSQELGEIRRKCEHTNLAKGRLMFSPRQGKNIQTYHRDENSNVPQSPDECITVWCQDCDKEFGWFCPKSPKTYCEYNQSEYCIYCGMPSERK